jgi:hypothetical protein
MVLENSSGEKYFMTAKGTIPSKPSYRKPKGWNLTHKQMMYRMRIAEELREFNQQDFPKVTA